MVKNRASNGANVLTLLLVGFTVGQSSLILTTVAVGVPSSCQSGQQPNDLSLDKMASRYSIQIVVQSEPFQVQTTHGNLRGLPTSEKELKAYIPLLVFEFSVYPTELVKNSKLQRIVLCQTLSYKDQRRKAAPDFEHDTLFLDVEGTRRYRHYMRGVIHHEFFHMVDFRDDGELYQDKEWAAFNPDGFAYGSGGKDALGDATAVLPAPNLIGFWNRYSQMGVEEDKAEIFANMIVNLERVEDRAIDDSVLGLKLSRMKELLQNFSPAINAEFWERVRKHNREAERQRR